jgi:hypothetical protein
MNIFSPLNTRWLTRSASGMILASLLVVLWPELGSGMLLVISLASLPLILRGLSIASSEHALSPPGLLARGALLGACTDCQADQGLVLLLLSWPSWSASRSSWMGWTDWLHGWKPERP